jgi:G3E family GTPase
MHRTTASIITFLQRLDDEIVLLQSGCLCCTIRGDLSAAMRDLYSKRERGEIVPFRRLVIETTGLADPVSPQLGDTAVLINEFGEVGPFFPR